ncbi:MAG: hypothetical protein ACRC62_24830 [Microcoleus sp.]
MLHFAENFANEFNDKAAQYFRDQGLHNPNWNPVTVTSAYPTTKRQCPSIAVMQSGSSAQPSGLSNYLDERPIEIDGVLEIDGVPTIRIFNGQVKTDTIEVAICTLNPKLRDDLSLWFGQWMLDAAIHVMPQLSTVHEIRQVNCQDDMPQYDGCADQPGFQFYLAQHSYRITYTEIVLTDVDRICTIFDWQELLLDD